MSATAQPPAAARAGLAEFISAEYPLFIGLGSAAFFLVLGGWLVGNVDRPATLAVTFVWLFIGVLWSAISVVRHADSLAIRCGEPYGTLILTLSAITIEVI